MEIQGSFCSEPPHGFIYDPCELGKRRAVCLFYFILLRLLVRIGMCACVLRNNFADHFLLSLGHGAGPGPNATAGSDGPLSLFHITARFPGQVLLGREKSTRHCPGTAPPSSAMAGSPAQGWRKSLRSINVPVLTRRPSSASGFRAVPVH